jgi:uncharacterized protein with beta-barrel porin domain
MMNKAINTLVLATVDSLTKFKKKFSYYLAIFAMVFGSTSGFNTAYAADGQAVGIATGATVTSSTTNIVQSDVTFQTTESAATTFTVDATGDFAIDLFTTEDGGDAAGPNATINITGGALTIDETATMLAQTAASVYTMKIASGASVLLGGAAVVNSNGTFNVELQGGTFTAQEADAQAIAFNFDSDSGADGVLNALNAGVKAFAGTVGATNGLASITIGSATDDAGADFAETVQATTITVIGGESSGENSTAIFAKAVTGNLVLTDGAHADAHVTATFDGTAAQTAISGTITGSTARSHQDTFIVILDSASGAPAAQTFAGQIGTSDNKIGTITVGATNGNAGSAIFSEDVYATNLAVIADNGTSESSTVSLSKAFTGTAITLDDDTGLAKLVVAGTDTTIAGTINGAGADGEGTLQVTGAGTTISGNVGATGSRSLLAIDVNATTTFSGTTEATTMTVDADTTFSGAALANTGTTIATSGTDVTYSAASSTGATTLASGTTLTSAGVLTTGDLTNTSGKVYLSENANVSDNIILAGTGELHIGKAVASGETINTGSTSDDNSFPTTAKVYLPSNLSSGETILWVDSGGWNADGSSDVASSATALDVILQDTALVNYSATGDTNTLTITATDKTATAVATELGATKNVGTALLQAMASLDANSVSGDTAAFTAFDNAMKAQGGETATSDTDLALQVAPQTDTIGGSAVATSTMTGTVQGIVSNRMASLRSGDAFVTGMSAGNGMSANSGFIQAFGSEAEQKNNIIAGATTYGYDSQTSGVAIGFDGMTETGETIGLSASYSSTDVDGKGTGKSKNAIDSYTVSVYADKATDNGYIEGSLTYGINDNTSSRIVNTAGLSRTYAGNYDSEQISLKVGGGAPQEVKDGTFVTPFLTATGTIISTDAYTETSTTASDALRLKIAQDDINSLVGTVGVKAHMVTDNGTPMISLAVNNEFGDSQISSQNTYTGGGTAFKTTTEVEELSATLGLGFSFGNDVTSLNLNYEANVNDDEYLNQYGSIKIVAKF